MALRAAATAEWSCDYSGALELLDGILNTEATGTYRQMAVAHRHYLLARSRQLSLDEAGALLLGDFEQLAADDALRGASGVATRALTILRVAGTTPNEELLAFGRRALQCAERLGDPIVIATLQVRVTQVLVALDRREETLKAFETADALFSRIDPVRRIQVAAVRGRVLAEWGDHAAARLNLKRYLNGSAARSMPTGVSDAALSPVGIVTIQTCRAVMARLDGQDPSEVEESLLAAVKDRGANYGAAVRRITTAALSGIAPTKDPTTMSTFDCSYGRGRSGSRRSASHLRLCEFAQGPLPNTAGASLPDVHEGAADPPNLRRVAIGTAEGLVPGVEEVITATAFFEKTVGHHIIFV